MRIAAVAAMAACLWPAAASAASRSAALAAPSALETAAPSPTVRVAMRQETLPAGGKLGEHRQDGERYLYVVSGQLKVSNLVTGEEQMVGPGRMAAEQPGDWHVAEAVGTEPATFYLIDRTPADAGAAQTVGN